VNSASPKLALRFMRSRVNQPDPTFPQSPGIIRETNDDDGRLRRQPQQDSEEQHRENDRGNDSLAQGFGHDLCSVI